MTADATPDDPFGYGQDLELVLDYPTPDAPNPIPVVLALARCAAFGVPVPDDQTARARRHLPAVVAELLAEIDGRTDAARTLDNRYDETDDPWEADAAVRVLVEYRALARGLELIAADTFGAAVARFDTELREHADLVGSVAGSVWFENLRLDLPAEVATTAWWLSDHLAAVAAVTDRQAEATLPPPEYFAVVRQVRTWKAAEPNGKGVMAANVNRPAQSRRFVWQSPDGLHTATLDVAARMTDEDKRTVPFPLIFETDPGTPAVELVGTPIRLGTVTDTVGTNGEVSATVVRWWAESDGRLFVGSAEREWPRVITPEVPDGNP